MNRPLKKLVAILIVKGNSPKTPRITEHNRWVTAPPEGWVDGARVSDSPARSEDHSLSESLTTGTGEILSRPAQRRAGNPPKPADGEASRRLRASVSTGRNWLFRDP